MAADFDVRVRELLNRYDTEDACAANLLCDDHPADAVEHEHEAATGHADGPGLTRVVDARAGRVVGADSHRGDEFNRRDWRLRYLYTARLRRYGKRAESRRRGLQGLERAADQCRDRA